ncbi:MAG: thiamine diphosphokinase [Chloroflexota bacterium]|nr:thiamine diphosphokinase [Chloroflexota bacterium]
MNTPSRVRKAVVVADAPAADLEPFRELLRDADLVVAADGGARYLLALDLLPHVAVGDFDSLAAEAVAGLVQAGVEVLRHSVHKNETDLELALLQAIERGATCIHVLAALGGRPDQHLANLQLLTHPRLASADVRLVHRDWEMFAIRREAAIFGAPNDVVSLLPMTEAVTGITTRGLYYPLRGETLRLGPARGISNLLTHDHAQVTIESGILLCMHQRRLLDPHSALPG